MCCTNYFLLAFVLWCGYCFILSFETFGLCHSVIATSATPRNWQNKGEPNVKQLQLLKIKAERRGFISSFLPARSDIIKSKDHEETKVTQISINCFNEEKTENIIKV